MILNNGRQKKLSGFYSLSFGWDIRRIDATGDLDINWENNSGAECTPVANEE